MRKAEFSMPRQEQVPNGFTVHDQSLYGTFLLLPKLNLDLTFGNAHLVSRHGRASGPFAHAAVSESKA